MQHNDRSRRTVVVIGNGMVGHRFVERLVEFDAGSDRQFQIVTFCEEPRPAYDRVQLTKFFEYRDAEKLMLARREWYDEQGVQLHVGDKAVSIDRERKVVRSEQGREIPYDVVVLATGSVPFVPTVPGVDKSGVFVYRTIEDLERIVEFSRGARSAAVIGGGLLGLEAAKAAYDLGLETHVVEFASRLMPRQVDDDGSKFLVRKIETLGVRVHLNKNTKEFSGNGQVDGLDFADGSRLDAGMVIISAGIKPRDELARACGLEVGQRGGVVVNESLQTSDPNIFAIGEVALYQGMIYGLVAPGYEMAETAAAILTGQDRRFTGADMSTKLKLMGVDVASFGNPFLDEKSAKSITYEDPFTGVYKKLVFSLDGRLLLGGILVGDATDYGTLLALCKSGQPLSMKPGELLIGSSSDTGVKVDLGDEAQICSCNNVSRGDICSAIRGGSCTLDELKKCTKAGTGCGGCVPLVLDILKGELKAAGKKVNNNLCPHFAYTRQELFQIVKIKRYQSFDEVVAGHGKGNGCEICKPAVASILASLWNDNIMHHATIQDTNDRFLANMQRGGLYSVIPRIPGGEITPDKLMALGRIAKKYGLYTKITGGQRIDMFGAAVHDLPNIWGELVEAGFESGHAYGKAMRTVKSCVGTTWCRYGVGDSVGLAIRVEERYRGLRSPHKLKSAVSGCIRECAEAQCKDFGLIATERGWNLYVCGNGGAKPRHADLLAGDLDEDTCLKYLDRFLMFYIQTADRLTRTAPWLEKMEGGIEYLRDVVVNDRLGICEELEKQMQYLVDTYKCEWKEAVNDPSLRKWFRQFVNTTETEPSIEFVSERGQKRPVDWTGDFVAVDDIGLPDGRTVGETATEPGTSWIAVGKVWDFPHDGGATIKYGGCQIAVFNFSSRGEWYATQNMCPHRREFVLSRGIVGDHDGEPKVACPLHKKTYSLRDGQCLTGENYKIKTFEVKVDGDDVYLNLPPIEVLDEQLATRKLCNGACHV
jgi:nitrite reductase (NADH) large subunit